jgi:hypothetical protein
VDHRDHGIHRDGSVVEVGCGEHRGHRERVGRVVIRLMTINCYLVILSSCD